ncbi:hypothetical protein [Kitasatospora acidiphila]|uniref:hypothetical protein n=1 Tax=Kitasatospora acidiphila TaxID=2567942 RepID=UPI0015F0E797|nr:hypothetical protein [Kitasatospora acidiphila]
MTTTLNSSRTALRTLAVGAIAAFLAAAAPAAASAAAAAAAPHTTARSTAAATRAGEVIQCQEVNAEESSVFGRNCNTDSWGPLSDFTVTNQQGSKWQCATGWAEGALWINGQDCKPLP